MEGCKVSEIQGENQCIFGLVGDTTRIDPSKVEANEHVERVTKGAAAI